jgi:hypothetical protein
MSLPENLQFFVKRIAGYSRQTYRLQSVNNDQAVAGGFVVIDLPNNALVDLSTFDLHFRATSTGTGGNTRLPRHIETLIDSLHVEVNGQLVSSIPTNYNQVMSMVLDSSCGVDTMRRRQILQNAAPLTAPGSVDAATAYCIQNWLGFLGSAQPQCIDTGALGNVRIRIGLSTAAVVLLGAGASAPGFSLTDIFATIDCLSIDDGEFHQSYSNFLASGGILEIPYQDIYSFSAGNIQSSGTLRFSLSTQSLDMVMATFVENTTTNNLDTVTGTTRYFKRTGDGITGWQFGINNVMYPQYRPDSSQAYAILTNALNVSQDSLGGMTPELNSLTAWRQNFWIAAYRFAHDADNASRTVAGVDSRGSVSQCVFEFTGLADTANAKLGLVFAFAKAVLAVGAGRLITKIA